MKRLAIFSYYDPAGAIRQSSLELVKELNCAAAKLIIVVNGHLENKAPFSEITDAIVFRQNTGYDVGAYHEIIMSPGFLEEVKAYDELIFCNSSFFGPFIPLKEIFEKMESSECDFWGISSSEKNLVHHIQSYFLVFRKSIASGDFLQDYFKAFVHPGKMDYADVCNVFENGLCGYLLENGFSFNAYKRDIACDCYFNPYGSLALDGLPILKKKIFEKDFFDRQQVLAALHFIKEQYHYDVNCILEEAVSRYGIRIEESDLSKEVSVILKTDFHQNALLKDWKEIKSFIDKNNGIYIYGNGYDAAHVFNSFFFTYLNPGFSGFITCTDIRSGYMKEYPVTSLEEMKDNKEAAILVCVDYEELEVTKRRLSSFTNTFFIWKSLDESREQTVYLDESLKNVYGKYYYNGRNMLVVTDRNNYYQGILGWKEMREEYTFGEDTPVSAIYNADGKVLTKEPGYEEKVRTIFRNGKIKYLPLLDTEGRFLELISRQSFLNDNGFDFTKHNKSGKRISFVIPKPIKGSGGNRTILRLMRYLSQAGHRVTAYVYDDSPLYTDALEVEQCIQEDFYPIEMKLVIGVEHIEECDILIATYWRSAYIVKDYEYSAGLACYLIQDIESMFCPMGYDYIEAYNTYKLGLFPITYGPKVRHSIQNHFGQKEGIFADFSVDSDIYYPRTETGAREWTILFAARPEMTRRCYPLGVKALKIVKRYHPEVQISFFGAPPDTYRGVPFSFCNLGILSPGELGDLYRNAMLGVCFSTTNPSLIPYEMMRCGLPVVDIDFNENEYNYDGYENVVLAGPTPEEVAKEIIRLIENEELRALQSKRGIAYTEKLPDDEAMEVGIAQQLMEQLDKVRHSKESVE